MKVIRKTIWLFLFAIIGCSGGSKRDIDKVHLTELSGASIDLSQYNGKTVFINFWATWCKPCIQEMPTIAAAQKLKADVVFLMASDEEPEQIETFMRQHDYDFHYVHLEHIEALNIHTLPTTFIFNSEGKLEFSEAGFRLWNDPANLELITEIANDHEN